MLYVLICRDKPEGGRERRMAARPDHLSYLEAAGEKVRIAGAMLSSDEQSPIGSVIVIEAGTIDEARRFAQSDPFVQADVFSDVEIHPWRQGAGAVKLG
jgi:uncharacterized protein YciI